MLHVQVIRFDNDVVEGDNLDMRRTFTYRGEQWAATLTGGGSGSVGSRVSPHLETLSVSFECMADPSQPNVVGHVSGDLSRLTDDDLRTALAAARGETPNDHGE